jgi:enolase
MVIKSIFGREILDSRGKPTVKCHIMLSDGTTVTASTPAGASLGSGEAKELRDGDKSRYDGGGVLQAVANINTKIAPLFIGKKPDLSIADAAMLALDGTADKSHLGANAIIATSMAMARAQAHAEGLALYTFIGHASKPKFPHLMVNMINGGAHANNKLSTQEILVIPPRQETIAQEIEMAATFQGYLKKQLEQDGMSTNVGDEGGFAPSFAGIEHTEEERALTYLTNVLDSHHEKGFTFGLDVAASHFYDHQEGLYNLSGKTITPQELLVFYKQLIQQFPLVSIEDSFDEHDHDSWQAITKTLGNVLTLVGDDIFVSNPKTIQKGIDDGIANATIIKPNQIGTVSEAITAACIARSAGYKIVASHRSGETNDTFIADFAVGINADYLKAGGCMRGERVAKYNRLMEIEQNMNMQGKK